MNLTAYALSAILLKANKLRGKDINTLESYSLTEVNTRKPKAKITEHEQWWESGQEEWSSFASHSAVFSCPNASPFIFPCKVDNIHKASFHAPVSPTLHISSSECATQL